MPIRLSDISEETEPTRLSDIPDASFSVPTRLSDISEKGSIKRFIFQPISKQFTGKAITEHLGTAERRRKEMSEFAAKRALAGKPASVGELMLRGVPSVAAETLIDLADVSPVDIAATAALPGVGKAIGRIPFKGTTVGEAAKTIPLGRGFVKKSEELGRYEQTLKRTTPLSSRGIPGKPAEEVFLPKGRVPIQKEYSVEEIDKVNLDIKNLSQMLPSLRKRGLTYEVAEVENKLKGLLDIQKNIFRKSQEARQIPSVEQLVERRLPKEAGEVISTKPLIQPIPTIVTKQPKTPDFAENINLTKYPSDVRQTINDLIVKKPEIGKTPTISDKELISRAAQLKDTPTIKHLATLPEGTVEAEALKLRQGNTEMIRNALGGELESLKGELDGILSQGIELHRKTATMFGRGLRQQRLPAETQQQMAFTIDNAIKRISKDPVFKEDQELIDTVKKLREIVIDREFNPTLWNKVYSVWMNAILSNPFTHIVNTASNTSMTLLKLPEKFSSAMWDLPISKITGKRTQFFGEIPAMVEGLVSKEKLPQGLAMGSKIDVFASPIQGKIGKVIGTPSRLLQIEDNLAKNMVGKMELYAQRYAGKTGEALTKAVNEEQLLRTFQNDVGVVGNTLLVLKNKIPLLRYVVPFIKTPENLIARGLERTPLGAIKIARKAIAGTYTQETLTKDLGNLTLGTIGTGWIGLQWARGNITGKAPSDPSQRDAFYRQGKKPNAIKVGDRWIPFERLEPLGTAMATMVNMIQDFKNSDKENVPEKTLEAFTKLGSTLTNKTYLSGFTGMINALSDPERYGQSFLSRIAVGAEPQLLKFFTDLKDPYYREANSILEQFKAKTPFLSETLPPKLNVFGESIRKDFLNIGRVSQEPTERMIEETPVSFPSKMLGKEKLTPQEYRYLLLTSGQQIREILKRISPDKFMSLPLEIRQQIIDKLESKTRTTPRAVLRIQRELQPQ